MKEYSPLNYALLLLEKRDRSVGEVRCKMKVRGFDQKEIDASVKFLLEKNFLNDERFAKHYIQNQLSIKSLGRYRLVQGLKRKYVSEEVIEKVLKESPLDDKTQAMLAAKKWKKLKNIDSVILKQEELYKWRNKLAGHLANRGFGWDVVKEVLNKFDN